MPEATYREAVSAFNRGLAAMQTSQEVRAKTDLARVTALVPDEPAGWADLGLLALRQQDLDEAAKNLDKAAALAPGSAAIARLQGLLESRRGRLPEAIQRLRHALELEPASLKAAFALAQETERQGGAASEAETERLLAALLARSGNLAVRLELMRVAAKRGDGGALKAALRPILTETAAWPSEAQEQLARLREAADGDPRSAAPRVAFLRNVLVRVPEYRRALAAIATPREEVGEPLTRFLVLPNPSPRPAPADESLAFTVETLPLAGNGISWLGPLWLEGEGNPVIAYANGRELRAGSAVLPFPGGPKAIPPGPDGVLAVDLDNDFKTDLVLAGAAGVRLMRQTRPGAFDDVTARAQLRPAVALAAYASAWAADIDTDGDLDVVLAPADGGPVVLRNNGDGTFAEAHPFAGVASARGFAWADVDGEGVPDAAFLESTGRLRVFLNQRGGEFREAATPELPPLAGLAAIDSGGGSFDLVLLTTTGQLLRLAYEGPGFTSAVLGSTGASFEVGGASVVVADLDNNGGVDLVAAGEKDSVVLLRGVDGLLKPLAPRIAGRIVSAVDLDGSGRLALLGLDERGRPVRGTARGQKAYHWQSFRPRAATATGDQRINSFGIGGEIEVRSGLFVQKQPIAAPAVHFGLGDAASVDVVRVVWPNGVLQSEFETKPDAVVRADQRLKGSCPWLFAWNGREMGFVTDFIWRSPLGLRINAQATAEVAMTEDRVRIRGEQLQPKDDAYDLRITAELWETHFFDAVSLMAVDHPDHTEVYVDERFAVPSPALDVVATGPAQSFAAARDDEGRDVADVVRALDGRYLDGFGRGPYQGVTRDHFVEVELPETAPRSGPLFLLATGWVHPTDSSLNVALAQGKHARPEGLRLLKPDEGGWQVARGGLGFPAGKTKTIVLPIDGLFPRVAGPRRLRLATNLEVYWDRLAWAAGRPDVKLREERLALSSATLRYRGFSATEQADASSPERPRYVLAGTAARWLDLEGFHTRFGDVRELLQASDDRYVIMNAGDELLLRFPALPAPATGLRRDFVLIGDGWVKDGDFNTTASRTVLPLPTHRSSAYRPGTGNLEDDPTYRAHRADWAEYHTRYVTPAPTRDALRYGEER